MFERTCTQSMNDWFMAHTTIKYHQLNVFNRFFVETHKHLFTHMLTRPNNKIDVFIYVLFLFRFRNFNVMQWYRDLMDELVLFIREAVDRKQENMRRRRRRDALRLQLVKVLEKIAENRTFAVR